MKWMTHKRELPPVPGEFRLRRRFAWFPTTLSHGDVTVWLEFYRCIDVFQNWHHYKFHRYGMYLANDWRWGIFQSFPDNAMPEVTSLVETQKRVLAQHRKDHNQQDPYAKQR